MLGRISKFAVGLCFLPVVIGVSIAFSNVLGNIHSVRLSNSQFFLWGVVAYVVMHLFLFKPKYIYTVGHEATHAVSTWLCGGKVTGFKVSKEGGAVSTTKTNFFISLSPYFVPFYTLLISALYFLGSLVYNLSYLSSYFIFMIGFTLSLHIISTVEVMKLEQPDILRTGYLFSITLIYIMNIFLIAFIISLLFKDFSFEAFFKSSYHLSKDMYVRIFNQLFSL